MYYKSLQINLPTSNGISLTSGMTARGETEKHTHDFDEIVIIASGSGRQHVNNETYSAEEGDVFVIKGEALHYYENVENMYVYNIGYKPWVLKDFSPTLLKSSGYNSLFIFEPEYRRKKHFSEKMHIEAEELKELIAMLEKLKAELKIPCNELSVTGLFMQITGYICRFSAPRSNSVSEKNTGKKVIDYIEENLAEPISLSELAEFSGMSKNGIVAMFSRLYGITPLRYINNARLYKAEFLLKNTDKSITELALECGFGDSNYFARVFKAYRGKTPREYRKESRK
ncbi:MAG: helix-turn-helix domain-containing protein [Clostridia bacterium]|nr:helix-turn-helix domain-containing protein [Clostridia bacterium]